MSDSSIEKLKSKLAELFQLDQADLDFGIYRIMNARRREISRFLEEDLLPQVHEAFQQYESADKASLKKDLEEAIKGAQALGYDPDTAPKVKELRGKVETTAVDVAALENEVYDHLYSFFRRYYDEGDFISMRRYKEGVYAIPYEGEEVKLHWANQDQYYTKTAEYFRDYAFKTKDGHCVHFKIVEADTEKDNVKATNGKDRRFVLYSECPVADENGELVARFEFRPDDDKRNQEAINTQTVQRILAGLNSGKLALWQHRLNAKWKRVDGTESDRSILEKHLNDYTKRNTFDYFIHKDLGGFLCRELDFYIKSEVMRLDDVEEESIPRVEQYLSKIKVIRRIARKIIGFLAQIENFQKKLWLKKKFVIETQYCITLDHIFAIADKEKRDWFIGQVIKNDFQREEWCRLFAIDEIEGDLHAPNYSNSLTTKFLMANDKLVLDTRFFDEEFRVLLNSYIDNLNYQHDGLLIHSENFHALNLLQESCREGVKCIYIDPPYNAKTSEIIYKNTYKHASWLSLIQDRTKLADSMRHRDSVFVCAIDENEQERLGMLLGDIFSQDERACVSVIHNPRGIQGAGFSYTHEFAYFVYRRGLVLGLRVLEDAKSKPLMKTGSESERDTGKNCFYPIYVRDGQVIGFGEVPTDDWHPDLPVVKKPDGSFEVWPISSTDNLERKWRYARQSIDKVQTQLEIHKGRNGEPVVYLAKDYESYRTVWTDAEFNAAEYGSTLLKNILGDGADFSFPKSVWTVSHSLRVANVSPGDTSLDFFAGSGTTGHAVINLNREDDGKRKYILVEMGDYFDTVLKPRIQKVVYSKDWKDGKPVNRNTGISHIFKYIRLESYEDALANLRLRRTEQQQELLNRSEAFRESFMIRYLLDEETKASPSLLDIDQIDDPFSYKLLVGTGSVGETKPVNVDLVETFNWLLGLKVRHIDSIEGFRIVEGTNPKGEKVLVIWRKIRDLSETDTKKIEAAREKANEALEKFFRKQQYNTLDMEFDLIYVNGDNNLMNIPLSPEKEGVEPRYKVRLIEEEFKRLMFDVKDV